MFRVKKGYLGIVSTKGYLGDITKAPAEVLEDLYHKNHIGVEFVEEAPEGEEPAPKAKKKKKVDKAIDNAKEE
jgi:hypothetical protein